MAEYLVEGNKTVRCMCGSLCTIPFQTTIHQCSVCGNYCVFPFSGVIVDKYGNYVY